MEEGIHYAGYMVTFEEFSENLNDLNVRIQAACDRAGRAASEVRLLPVTKTHPPEIVEYVDRIGMGWVGENRVQEAQAKKTAFSGQMEWVLIGHLQSNKAKQAVETFDVIQSVDRIKLVNTLNKLALEKGIRLPILLQVNAGEDPAKFGASRDEAVRLAECALQSEALAVRGLMTIAPLGGMDIARRTFVNLRETRDSLEERFECKLPELSMGMSSDLEVAIEEGSTCIRVGSALFGSRG